MTFVPLVTYALLGVNVLISLYAFSQYTDRRPTERFLFIPSEVAEGRNLGGMFLSQFSHGDLPHLLFNMITLYFFGPVVEQILGPMDLVLIYAVAGAAATLATFVIHKREPMYRALGASGAISGVLFAAIVLFPEMSLYFMVPIPIPAPIFAIGYVVISIIAARRRRGNVGHEAHIGGALAGLVLAGVLSSYGFGPLIERMGRMFG